MICSIVQIVDAGAICSYPVGRREVNCLAPYRASAGAMSYDLEQSARGRNWEETRAQARELCERYNQARYSPHIGIRYEVEELDEDSPERAQSCD